MTYKPGQKRGAAGTDLGGQFIGAKSIARALIKMMTPHEAETHDAAVKARAPKGGPAIGRLMARPSKASARMDSATHAAIAADHKASFGPSPAPRGDALAAARAHVADMQRKAGGTPSAPEALSGDPATRAVQVENRIRQAYSAVLSRKSDSGNRWVGLADLRSEMGGDVSRNEVDAALKRLEQADGVNVVPESNQKTLTPADRESAVVIGDQPKHAITIDNPSPRPLPSTHSAGGAPSAPDALSDDPAVRAVQVQNRVRAAYVDARAAGTNGKYGDYVSLADIRDRIGSDVPRADVDEALRELGSGRPEGAYAVVVPESNQKTLTPRQRDASLQMGGQTKHLISIKDPSPLPTPSASSQDGAQGIIHLDTGGRISREDAARIMYGSEGAAAKLAKATPAKKSAAAKMTPDAELMQTWARANKTIVSVPGGGHGAMDPKDQTPIARLTYARDRERQVKDVATQWSAVEGYLADGSMTPAQVAEQMDQQIVLAEATRYAPEVGLPTGIEDLRAAAATHDVSRMRAAVAKMKINVAAEIKQARADLAAPAKPTAAAKMTRAKAAQAPVTPDMLRNAQSADDIAPLLENRTAADLRQIAADAGIHVGSKATKQQVKDAILHHGVQRRVNADAISRPAPSAVSPSAPKVAAPLTDRQKLAAQRAAIKAHRAGNTSGRSAANETMASGDLGSIDAAAQAIWRGSQRRQDGSAAPTVSAPPIKAATTGPLMDPRSGRAPNVSTHPAEAALRDARTRLAAGEDPGQVAKSLREHAATLKRDGVSDRDATDMRARSDADLKELRDIDVAMLQRVAAGLTPTPAKKGAAAQKMTRGKVAAAPPETIAARIQSSASEAEARAHLAGLTLPQLRAIAKITGGGTETRKAALIDAIIYNGVGFRLESTVLRRR